MEKPTASKDEARQEKPQPYRVRLPGFVSDREIGLGDVVKRATYAVGMRPCGGCERRAVVLNRWFVLTR